MSKRTWNKKARVFNLLRFRRCRKKQHTCCHNHAHPVRTRDTLAGPQTTCLPVSSNAGARVFHLLYYMLGPSRSYYEKDRTTETIKSKTKHFSLAAAGGTLSIPLIYSFANIMQNPSLHSSRCCCLSSSTDITIILSSSSSSSSFKPPAASKNNDFFTSFNWKSIYYNHTKSPKIPEILSQACTLFFLKQQNPQQRQQQQQQQRQQQR